MNLSAYGASVRADRILIGMRKRNNCGGWEWGDGTPTDFTRWAQGEPNNHNPYGKPENCVELHSGLPVGQLQVVWRVERRRLRLAALLGGLSAKRR